MAETAFCNMNINLLYKLQRRNERLYHETTSLDINRLKQCEEVRDMVL